MSYSDFVPTVEPFPRKLFKSIAKECTNSDIICLGGIELGYGPCLMMECLQAFDKRTQLYVFDLFATEINASLPVVTPWGEPAEKWLNRIGGPLAILDQFLIHIHNSPCLDRLTDWCQAPTLSYFGGFEDESLFFMFLNANHDESKVSRELNGWWPKIRDGGKLGVYGVNESGITKATVDFCNSLKLRLDISDNAYIISKT